MNNNKYKEFYFGSLISEIYKAKAINKDDLDVANNKSTSINYITRTGENNGCEMLADIAGISENYIEKGNAITIGDTTATCFYQEKQFIAGDHMVLIRADWLNKYTGLYIVTLLTKEQYKYSYGRAFVKDKIKNTILKLPVDESGNPNRKFMEKYMKTLHYKPITTKNKSGKFELNVNDWKEFRIGDLFNVNICKSEDLGGLEEGNIPFVGRTELNNGIQGFVESSKITKGNCISVSMVGTNVALRQDNDFVASQNIAVLRNDKNKYVSLFICALLNSDFRSKYCYGRTIKKVFLENTVIKLPVDSSGNPDREFMEYYIKNLPYGDRI